MACRLWENHVDICLLDVLTWVICKAKNIGFDGYIGDISVDIFT